MVGAWAFAASALALALGKTRLDGRTSFRRLSQPGRQKTPIANPTKNVNHIFSIKRTSLLSGRALLFSKALFAEILGAKSAFQGLPEKQCPPDYYYNLKEIRIFRNPAQCSSN